jgi:cohesin loading factor subunit SCC2
MFCYILSGNMQLLQLKAVAVICTVIFCLLAQSFSTHSVFKEFAHIQILAYLFTSYTQHRSYLDDETLHLLRRLQFSKNDVRTYHLEDEDQKQIQMITKLLVHLVQFSAIVPNSLKEQLIGPLLLMPPVMLIFIQ